MSDRGQPVVEAPGSAEEFEFDLGTLRIAAKGWGERDATPLLALHGWLDNAASFDRLAPLLPHLRLVALDMPGHGLSSHRPAGCRSHIWDDLPELLQCADQLGWHRFHLLGHSRGAGIATLLAAAVPERVISLTLIENFLPGTTEDAAAPSQLAAALRDEALLPGKKKPIYRSVAEAIEARTRIIGEISREAAALLTARGLMQVEGGYSWRADPRLRLASMVKLTPAQTHAFAAAVAAPTLLILAQGGRFDRIADLNRQLDAFRQLELHRLPGNHHLHLERQAPEVAALLADFIQRHPGDG